MKPSRRPGLASLTICLALSLPLAAQSTWNGNSSANWSNSANWSPAIPASGANVIIADTTTNGLTLDDGSRTIGSLTYGTNGTRTSAFTLQTNTANTLTLQGGVISLGNYTGGIGPRLRGHMLIPTEQTWLIGGEAGSHTVDRGLAINEVSSGNLGTFTLQAPLNKSGTGQLTMGATTVSGAANLRVHEGSLKLNAGGSLPLTVTGPGAIEVNNSALLIFSRNSGTFDISRPIRFNQTAGLITGSGSNNNTNSSEITSNMEWNGVHTITNNTNLNNSGNVNYRFSGVMSGSGALTKAGPSQLSLEGTAANTHNGQITVTAGELQLNKTGALAVQGNILITGGALRVAQSHQIADSSTITVTGGNLAFTGDRAETIAALTISSGATSSVSGYTVTGATAFSAGIHEINSSQSFATHSLALSNNAALRFVGNATAPQTTTATIGAGGLNLDTGRIIFGNNGNASTIQLNLAGNVTSSGTSIFTATNYNGPRIVDLQGGTRSFSIQGGSLDIRTTVQNGTLVKSGDGTLILSRGGSTANLSLEGGPVRITTPIDAGTFSQSAGTLTMDVGGATPTRITTTGDVAFTGGSIALTALNGSITPGTFELIRYGGTLSGSPDIIIPAELLTSRMAPVIDPGTGTNSAITLSSTALPLNLTWQGANGGIWDLKTTANFEAGSETFHSLDSVLFGDTASNPVIQIEQNLVPTAVTFHHGSGVPLYTLQGSGGIGGTAKITKNGTGTTIIANANTYTGGTDVLAGTLQLGNNSAPGSLGSGGIFVENAATLRLSPASGTTLLPNVITGTGNLVHLGAGTTALTATSNAFAGNILIQSGTLQLGDATATGTLGAQPIEIAGPGTLAVKLTGTPTIANSLSGGGSLLVDGGNPILSGYNTHTGGVSVINGASIRIGSDSALGQLPELPIPNAIRLNHGGIKNQDSFTLTDMYRGVHITGEAYFTAGWAKSLTIAGPISGQGDIYVTYDSGTVKFTDPGSTWNGILTLGSNKPGASGTTGGILEVLNLHNAGTPGPLGLASAAPENWVFNGGRLIYLGSNAATNRGFTLQTSGTIDIGFDTVTFSGTATGPGSLTKAGGGKLILSGNNDFAGEKIVAGGSLVAASATALGTTDAFVRFTGSTGVLDLAVDDGLAPYKVTIGAGNSGTIASNRATPGFGVNHLLGHSEFSTVTVNVTAGDRVTGGDPRITFASVSASAGASGTTTFNPTTAHLSIGGASITSGNFAKTISLGGTSQDNHLSGPVEDGLNILSLRKDNLSHWTLGGENTFSGNVTVDNGALTLAHSQALGNPAKTLIVAGDAGNNRIPELRLSGGISPTVANMQISGAGLANLTGALRNLSGNNTLTVTGQVTMRTGNGNTTLHSDEDTLTLITPLLTANATNRALTLSGDGDGVIQGVIANGSTANLPITKIGSGTWSLIGPSTYSGATTVNEGTLSLHQPSLHDAASVVIADGATLHLAFTGTDRVGSLIIDGQTKPDGVYNATTDPGFLTGTGSIRVGEAPQGFDTWAASFPFTPGLNDGPMDDPDGDGIRNLLEYILGGIPVGPGASNPAILPVSNLTPDDLVLTFRRSRESRDDSTLTVQWSEQLATWHDFATLGTASSLPAVEIIENSPTAGFDTITVRIPRATSPSGKLFGRLKAAR